MNWSSGQRQARTPEARQVVWVCVFLALAVLAVFGQTGGFGFVNYDDPMYVYENPVVQEGLTWKGALWALTYGQIGHWHPLTWLTHMGDCQIYGLWAGGHHWTNVALHAFTTVLLFLVLRVMTGALWRSAFVAAVFAMHPLRAESVAWIAERKDVLSGVFFMLTLWAYARYVRQPTRGRYVAVALLYVLGLLSKNMLVTLPFLLLLLDWWPLGRMKLAEPVGGKAGSRSPGVPFWGLVKEKVPLLLLSAGSCIATALVPEHIWRGGHVPVLERVGNALVCYVVYLRQMVFPTGLVIPYLFPPKGLPMWKVCTALIALAAVTAGVFASRRQRPYLLVGWLWYLGMLVPAIGLVQISFYAHADRYTYLPGIGMAIAGTWAVADWSVGWKHRRVILAGLMMAVMGTLTVCGHIQTSYWRNSQSLWTHVLACAPSNCVAHNCLGIDFFEKGNKEKAIVEYRKALETNPDNAESLVNLGIALFDTGKKKEAIVQYRKALETNPDSAGARASLAVALFADGEKEEAIVQYRKALEIKPDYAEARSNLGLALFDKGEKEEAIAQYRKAVQIDPLNLKAEYNLGNALATEGHLEEAIAHFRKTVEIKPDYAYAHYGLGSALCAKEAWEEAIAQYRAALEIKPDFAEARHGLGKALLRKGDFDGAMACFQKATTLSPDTLERWRDLGGDLLQKGDLEEAIACYRQAIRIDPRSGDAYANLGLAFFQKGESKEAIDSWQQALATKPDLPDVQNNLAWLLATAPDASLRNGAKAVALAEQAKQLTGGLNPMVLHTLAAAYAETGRYGDATATARRALELAVAQKNDDLTAKLPKEMKLYEAGTPMRDVPQ
jgi:tetratricopeptide (TPR) repeat protein